MSFPFPRHEMEALFADSNHSKNFERVIEEKSLSELDKRVIRTLKEKHSNFENYITFQEFIDQKEFPKELCLPNLLLEFIPVDIWNNIFLFCFPKVIKTYSDIYLTLAYRLICKTANLAVWNHPFLFEFQILSDKMTCWCPSWKFLYLKRLANTPLDKIPNLQIYCDEFKALKKIQYQETYNIFQNPSEPVFTCKNFGQSLKNEPERCISLKWIDPLGKTIVQPYSQEKYVSDSNNFASEISLEFLKTVKKLNIETKDYSHLDYDKTLKLSKGLEPFKKDLVPENVFLGVEWECISTGKNFCSTRTIHQIFDQASRVGTIELKYIEFCSWVVHYYEMGNRIVKRPQRLFYPGEYTPKLDQKITSSMANSDEVHEWVKFVKSKHVKNLILKSSGYVSGEFVQILQDSGIRIKIKPIG